MHQDAELDQCAVVVNADGQYSIWPVGDHPPPGWREVGWRGSSIACVDYIELVWMDLRPRGVREWRAGLQPEAVPEAPRTSWQGGWPGPLTFSCL